MTPLVRSLRSAALVGTSVGGIVAGHQLGYLAAISSADHRHAVLARTGHGYLPGAAWVAGALAVAALVAALGVGCLRRRGTAGGRFGLGGTAATLAALQTGGFVMLEIVERAAVGAPLWVATGPVLWTGIAAQLMVAVLGALVLRLFERAGVFLATLGASPARGPVRLLIATAHVPLRSRPFVAFECRGPPVLLV